MKQYLLAVGAAAMVTVAAPADAVPFTFDFSGAGVNSGSGDGNSRTYTGTQTGGTPTPAVQVRATGWSNDGSTINDSRLESYTGGLGVTSGDETGADNTHTIDNQNRQDFIVLQFSQAVQLTKGLFTPFNLTNDGQPMDADASVYYSNTVTTPWNGDISALNGAPSSAFDDMIFPDPGYFVPWDGTGAEGTSEWRDINVVPGDIYRNIWVVAAEEGAFTDAFKLQGLKVKTLDSTTPPVPEPATWAMMIAGFGFIGASLRRRKTKPAAATA